MNSPSNGNNKPTAASTLKSPDEIIKLSGRIFQILTNKQKRYLRMNRIKTFNEIIPTKFRENIPVKKDALYKPLLRLFRRQMKDLIKDYPSILWSFADQKECIWNMMHELKVPMEFMNLRGLHSIMLLIFSKI